MRAGFLDVDRLTITIVTDNYYDSLRPDPSIGKRFRAFPGASIHAEHGFSCHLGTVINGESHFFMFDYGIDPLGVINNMDLLGIDPGKIDAFGLSHGHFDHWSGLLAVLGRASPGVCLYVGEEAFVHRYSRRPGSDDLIDLSALKREEIENLGTVRLVQIREPVEAIPGCYLSGNIQRVTEYEQGSPALLVEKGGRLEQDHFPGEQAAVCNVKGKGIVILTGCAHAGIVNTIKHAQKMSGIEKVHAVIGGFHLINAAPELIEKTISDIKQIAPDYIIPAHCTGFEAIAHLAAAMPGQCILNTAGTHYEFSN